MLWCPIVPYLLCLCERMRHQKFLHSMDKRNVMPAASIVSIGVRLLVKNEISLNLMPEFKRQLIRWVECWFSSLEVLKMFPDG